MNILYWMEDNEWPHLARGTEHAAGWDLVARCTTDREISPGVSGESVVLGPGTRFLVNTGLYLAMKPGICAMLCSRSGLSINHGVVVLNAPGIVDADYRGEVKVTLANLSDKPHTIHAGDRIAQLVFVPVFPECAPLLDTMLGTTADVSPTRMKDREDLGASKRGAGGFGSTGR